MIQGIICAALLYSPCALAQEPPPDNPKTTTWTIIKNGQSCPPVWGLLRSTGTTRTTRHERS